MIFQRITRERTCPVCKGANSYRVKRAGLSIKLLCRILNLRPHWCPDCDTFFLGPKRSKDVRVDQRFSSHGRPPLGGYQPQAGSLSH